MEKQTAHTDPEFFPENVEFLGFIGGWNCETDVDTLHMLFYLIRTKDLDWLEAVTKDSNKIISRKCVISVPRGGSKREAAARLLDAYVRSRVHYECPVPPSRSGLLTNAELKTIVLTIADERERNRASVRRTQ
jgi:hypothetical protein